LDRRYRFRPVVRGMTDAAATWPAEPGYPLNPERDGWHWLRTPTGDEGVAGWDRHREVWFFGDEQFPPAVIGRAHYLGAVPTPAQHAAAVEAAVAQARREGAEAMRERCAQKCEGVARIPLPDITSGSFKMQDCHQEAPASPMHARLLRALPLPGDPDA
jgi:hypothetical protein